VEIESRLEKRIAAQIVIQIEALHHILERRVLVLICLERQNAHLLQQLMKTQTRGHLGAQHDIVYQHAQQAFCLRALAIGHAAADTKVFLACVVVCQRKKC